MRSTRQMYSSAGEVLATPPHSLPVAMGKQQGAAPGPAGNQRGSGRNAAGCSPSRGPGLPAGHDPHAIVAHQKMAFRLPAQAGIPGPAGRQAVIENLHPQR